MSKARLIVIAIVLILGGIWFFAPQSGPQTGSKESTDQPDPLSDSSEKRNDAKKSEASGRTTAQAGVPVSATPLPEGSQAPGEAALRALQAESTRPWTVRRTGQGNSIKTLVRGRWSSGNLSDVEASANAFVHDYSDSLLGVPADQVRFAKQETTDRTKVVYDQYVNETRVYGSTLVLFFEDGGLTRVQNDLVAKNPTLSGAPSEFTPAQAFDRFNASEKSAYENLSQATTKTILFPGSTALVYAYDFNVRETSTGKTYRVLYDAESQALIKKFPTQVQ